MNFPFNCLGCGHENYAEWSHIGRQVVCVRCGRVATVPAPMEPFSGETESGLAVRFACPVCGRNFAAKRALVGQKIRCNGCGAGVRVPAGNSFPVENASRGVRSANSGSSHAGTPATAATAGVRVPAGNSLPVANASRVVQSANSGNTHAMAPATAPTVGAARDETQGDSSSLREQLESVGGLKRRERTAVVLPSRAVTMEQVRQEAAEQETVATQEKAEKAKRAKKKKRKKAGFFDLKETLTLVGGVSVVVGVLAFLAWSFPDFRFPLGGLLAVIGVILYLLGATSLRQLAANEGFFKHMAYRFFPPYQLWFVVMRWEETQDYFAFFASGLIIMSISAAVIKTSPTSKQADQSERAYQDALDEWVRGKGPKPPPPVMKEAQHRND